MNIFNVNVNLRNVHAGHFLNGARHLLLNVAPDFANVDFFLYDNENVGHHPIFMNRDLNAVVRTAFEKAIDSASDWRHFADARYAERRHARNGRQYFRRNGGLSGWTGIICHSFFLRSSPKPLSLREGEKG